MAFNALSMHKRLFLRRDRTPGVGSQLRGSCRCRAPSWPSGIIFEVFGGGKGLRCSSLGFWGVLFPIPPFSALSAVISGAPRPSSGQPTARLRAPIHRAVVFNAPIRRAVAFTRLKLSVKSWKCQKYAQPLLLLFRSNPPTEGGVEKGRFSCFVLASP